MSLATERLRTLRGVYAGRGDARSGRDVAYLLYAGLLVAAIVAFPLIRAVAVLLAGPAVGADLQAPHAGVVVGVVCGVVLAGLTALGRLRGPVTPSPFFVTLLGTTDLPRRLALRRAFLVGALLVAVVMTCLGMLFAGVLVTSGAPLLWTGAVFVLACGCIGLIGSVLWLAGQCIRSRWLWILVAALLAGAALVGMRPSGDGGSPLGMGRPALADGP